MSLKFAFWLGMTACLYAQTKVLTRSFDNGRNGANTTEVVFTPAKVLAKGLQRFKSLNVMGDPKEDPRIEAQPLYVPNLTIGGKKHDVVFVATMANNVWAFDANEPDTNKHVLWKTAKPLGEPFRPPETQQPGQHRSTTIDLFGINIKWGILATPVIDADANRMYLANWIVGANGKPALFAHRLNLADGSEISPPIAIKATLTDAQGNPVRDANGKVVDLRPDQKIRAALLLVPLAGQHKTLFLATTGGEKPGAPHGWVVAIDVDTFTQTAAWVSTTNGFGGGIWQASQGLSADGQGNVYAVTGNGGYANVNGQTKDFNGKSDFAEAIVRLKYARTGAGKGTLTLDDFFIPFLDLERKSLGNYDYRDQDLGSAAPILPTGTNLLLAAGKDGILYVLDRGHLGKSVKNGSVLKSPPPIYVTFNGVGLPTIPSNVPVNVDFPLGNSNLNPSKTHHLHGSPVFWSGSNGPMLFTWGENESLRAWKVDTNSGKVDFIGKGAEIASRKLATSPNGIGGMPGGMLAVSSDGVKPHTGIVWTLAPIDGDANHDVVEGIARAYDATDLDATPIDPQTPKLKLLWDSKKSGVTFNFSKFCTPVVADGKLFVTTYDGRVDVYTLKP